MNKYLKITLKTFAWIVGVVIGLLLLVIVLIQVPGVQNFVKDKAISFLEDKIKTPVKIDRIAISFPKKIVLNGVYFESQEKDTLIAGEKLAVDISLFKLLDNQVEINEIDLQGITANVKRDRDSVFNFDYIINAFVSEQKKEPNPNDSVSVMKFSVSKINLDKIRVRFNDAISKNDLDAYVNHFDTKIENFDLDNLDFNIPKIVLNGLNVNLKQGIVEELAHKVEQTIDSINNSTYLKLKLKDIELTKVAINYNDEKSKLNTGLALEQLLLKFNAIDLKNQKIDLENVFLKDLKGGLTLGLINKIQEPEKKLTVTTTTNNWAVKLKNADFENLAFKFDDENSKSLNKGIDYMHLNLSDVNLKANNFYYSTDTIFGNITQLTAKDKSGLNIENLKTDFFYGPKTAFLKKLYLKTPQTTIQNEILVSYPSVTSIADNIGELGLDANLIGSKLGFKDVLLFMPDLVKQDVFKNYPNAVLLINSKITGKVKNLNIPNLELTGLGNIKVAASGKITGLPNVEKSFFDLNIRNLQSSGKDIYKIVPRETIPSSVQIPAFLSVKGKFKGTINNFFTDLNLASSFGSAKVKANYDQRIKNNEKYKAYAQLTNFDVGKLIKNDSIGKISLQAKVNGVGLDPKTANASLNGVLNSAVFNSYHYKNLKLNGDIKNGDFNASTGMKDPNLDFSLTANGSFKNKYPAIKLSGIIDSADLNKLNLYTGNLRIRTSIDADIKTADVNYLNGKISLNDILIAKDDERIILDSINVTALSNEERNSLILKSPFFNAFVKGKYQLTEIATALSNSISKYYSANTIPNNKKITNTQYFDFYAKLSDHNTLKQFVPALTKFEPILLKGRYNSDGDSITVDAKIPQVVYGTNVINNGVLKIDTKADALNYDLFIEEIKSGSIILPKTSLIGKAKENVLDYKLQIKDKKDKERYLIAGIAKIENLATVIVLDPNGLKLNYENWDVADNNFISLSDQGILAQNFLLNNKNQSIQIQSQENIANSPLAIDFNQFKIETITSIIEQDSLQIGGTIDGNVLVEDLKNQMTFTADLNVENFNFKTDTLGNIAASVNNKTANTFAIDVAITGQGNQVNLLGNYFTENSSFDMDLAINRLNLKSIQGFSFGNIKDASGYLSGNFNITGNTNAPKVLGELKFNEGALRITQTNTYFKSLNDKIVLNDEGIIFNKFQLSDSTNNNITINGKILTKTYTDYAFNLDVNTSNFKIVSSTEKDNELFYGDLYIDTRLRIRGDLNKPVVDGNLKVGEDTKFTIVLPSSDPSIADREGIVEFIDQDKLELQNVFIVKDSIQQSDIKGMDVSVNIEIDKEAELTMIIDKGNGDFVKVKGEAELTGGIDPSGKINLTGKYELQEGAYEMSFNFLRRKFDIKQGSSIVWTGEPMSATVDITAIYVANAAPIDLLDNQLGEVSAAVRNTYKQKLPFNVLLNMDGELLQPQITFDIEIPEGNYNVSTDIITNSETKLEQLRQQESELNKQVFALLLLNRFVGENPFASQAGGGGVETMVRQSVSKILSEQLNNLAGNLISGVELNFDLESSEDYTSGQLENRTDLNIGVSKRFLDDRLKVTVGSNFGLEGTEQPNRETNNIAGDISVDYQLSKDGRYMLRAYRKNEYQVALQGQIIETGVGFILTMDYNRFREILERKKDRKEQLPRRRERE